MEATSVVEGRNNFHRTFRADTLVMVVQCLANALGHFLEVHIYGDRGRRGPLIIPEGTKGRGWSHFSVELKKMLHNIHPINRHSMPVLPSNDNEKEKERTGKSFAKVVKGGHGQRMVALGGVDQPGTSQGLIVLGRGDFPYKGVGMLPLRGTAKSVL